MHYIKFRAINQDASNIPEDLSDISNIYTHGILLDFLEERNYTDETVVLNKSELPVFYSDIPKISLYNEQPTTVKISQIDITGICDCEVEDYPNPCLVFLWQVNAGSAEQPYKITKGIIFDAKDSDAYEYARKHYMKRSTIII